MISARLQPPIVDGAGLGVVGGAVGFDEVGAAKKPARGGGSPWPAFVVPAQRCDL